MRRYEEPDADSARWAGFEFRPGDIVIDAPSKSGTTWTQLLVALLVFGPDLPEPVGRMSIWLEQRTRAVEEARAILDRQSHRRFIKSHTPLDGIPMRDEVRYVCAGRDPRDAAVSMFHHLANLDRRRFAELLGNPPPTDRGPRPTISERIDRFIEGSEFPDWSVRFVAHHYSTFWDARHQGNVELFHFSDYFEDLPGEIMRLADHLDIRVDAATAHRLAQEAGIARVRARAGDVAPDAHMGIWKDTTAFFRAGRVGEWREVFTPDQAERYEQVAAESMPRDLSEWVHGGRSARTP